MNLDIKNYDHFRLTPHGGKRYDLFNRDSDKVVSISRDDYQFVACKNVEGWNKK